MSIRELRTVAWPTSSALRRRSRAANFTGAENAFLFSRAIVGPIGLPDDPEKPREPLVRTVAEFPFVAGPMLPHAAGIKVSVVWT